METWLSIHWDPINSNKHTLQLYGTFLSQKVRAAMAIFYFWRDFCETDSFEFVKGFHLFQCMIPRFLFSLNHIFHVYFLFMLLLCPFLFASGEIHSFSVIWWKAKRPRCVCFPHLLFMLPFSAKKFAQRAHSDKLYATQNQRANKGCACIRILRRDDLPYCRFTGASSRNLHPLMIMHAPFRPFRVCGA